MKLKYSAVHISIALVVFIVAICSSMNFQTHSTLEVFADALLNSQVILIQDVSTDGDGPHLMPPHPNIIERARSGEVILPAAFTDPMTRLSMQVSSSIGAPDQPSGTFRTLALLVEFTDNRSQVGATYFDSLMFNTGSGTLNNYYQAVSYGILDIVTVNLPSSIRWMQMPRKYSYYVDNNYGTDSPYPNNAQKLAEDAVWAADTVVDFSNYDNDNDGWVDTVFIIHAGRGAEFTGSKSDIWSHSWGMVNDPVVDGVTVNSYTTEPEYWQYPYDMTVGVFAHELGHVFGLPDLYDRDYSSGGVGDWSLMAAPAALAIGV